MKLHFRSCPQCGYHMMAAPEGTPLPELPSDVMCSHCTEGLYRTCQALYIPIFPSYSDFIDEQHTSLRRESPLIFNPNKSKVSDVAFHIRKQLYGDEYYMKPRWKQQAKKYAKYKNYR